MKCLFTNNTCKCWFTSCHYIYMKQFVHEEDKEAINKFALERLWYQCDDYSTFMDWEPYGLIDMHNSRWRLKIPLSTAICDCDIFRIDINNVVRECKMKNKL